MKIKVIATDLDGTLLNNKTTISKKNYEALNKFISLGGNVCFLTGRCYKSTKKFSDRFYDKTGQKIRFLGCLKGAILYDNLENKIIYEKVINAELATKIFEIAKKHKCCVAAYLKQDFNSKRMVVYGVNSLVRFLNLFKAFKSYEIINEWDPTNEVYKVNLSGLNFKVPFWKHKKNLKACCNEIKNLLFEHVDISLTANLMYEINSKDCNKGEAIKKISEILNISLEEFAAFGDSMNDLDMFKKVRLSIAVGNKNLLLKKYVDHTILGSQKTAVARGINKYIFDRK